MEQIKTTRATDFGYTAAYLRSPVVRYFRDAVFNMDGGRLARRHEKKPKRCHADSHIKAELKKVSIVSPLTLKASADRRYDIVSLGEIMLRLDSGESRIRVREGGMDDVEITFRAAEVGRFEVLAGERKIFLKPVMPKSYS